MEPKSIHTYFDWTGTPVTGCEVDVRIRQFPADADPKWLYYFALSLEFDKHGEWAHGGLQWAGVHEFSNTGGKGVNWGGEARDFDNTSIGRTNTSFTWQGEKWYRYTVRRANGTVSSRWRWQFEMLDYSNGTTAHYGIVQTRSSAITAAMVFTETGYGVKCDTPAVKVEWRNPRLYSEQGEELPLVIKANYNGTCGDPTNTNQVLLQASPPSWLHETNAPRVTMPDSRLWPA